MGRQEDIKVVDDQIKALEQQKEDLIPVQEVLSTADGHYVRVLLGRTILHEEGPYKDRDEASDALLKLQDF